uniref:Uncharacterized protein n=1 Tax=Arundo donax TaxID=35708 RepID=A0A0A9AUN1_ARUDO
MWVQGAHGLAMFSGGMGFHRHSNMHNYFFVTSTF